MLLSDLLGVPVVTTDGDELGHVHDVVLVQDGPMGSNRRAGIRLHAIAVGSRSIGSQLGHAQGTVEGPWLLRRMLHRPPRIVSWSAIVQRDEDRIVVDPTRLEDAR
jgi:PRC-barrel domain